MQRKGLVILLLIGLIAPTATTFLWMQFQKKMVKRAIKWRMITGIDREDLVKIKLSKSDAKDQLEWKHSKEFAYRGQYYDIAESETNGDSVTYWCWWDHEETRLHQQLMDLVRVALGNDPIKKERESRLFHFFQTLYCTIYTGVLPDFPTFQETQINFISLLNDVLPPRPPIPPPRTYS